MMWKFIAAVVAIIFFNHISAQELLIGEQCDEDKEIVLKVLFRYFRRQHFLTVVNQPNGILNSFECLKENFYRPLDVFNTTNVNFGSPIDTSSVSSYPTTHGYFVRLETTEAFNEFYEKVSNFNPRTKLLFDVSNNGVEMTNEVIRVGFDKFHMLNVATLTIVPRTGNGTGIISLCLYNPFERNSQMRFKCFNFTTSNLADNLKAMEKFQLMRIKNLQGFPLKVRIFEYEMKCAAVYDKNGKVSHYTYPDGELLNSMAEVMNFTPVYLTYQGGPKYGYQLPDGKFVGALASSENGEADLLANAKLIANYNTSKSVFLRPITMTKLKFIIQMRITNKKMILTVVSELDKSSKMIAISLFFIFPAVYILINQIELGVMAKDKKIDIIKNILSIHGLLNGLSMQAPIWAASRMVLTTVFFFYLMFTSLFHGSITKNLNAKFDVGRITSIDQLLEQNFAIRMQPVLVYAFQGQGDDKVTKELNRISRNLTKISFPVERAIELLKEDSQMAYLWTADGTGNYLDRYYNNVTGENDLEVVPESAFEFYIALMAPKASPFIDRFNDIMNIYVQTGLYQYHFEKASHDNSKVWINRVKRGFIPKPRNQALTIVDMRRAFKLYSGLIALCSIIFIVEYVIGFLQARRRLTIDFQNKTPKAQKIRQKEKLSAKDRKVQKVRPATDFIRKERQSEVKENLKRKAHTCWQNN